MNLVDVPGTSRVRIHGWLDREGAAVLRAAIDPLSAPRRGPNEADLRSPGQRRADALVEVCQRGLAFGKLPDTGGERPQLGVAGAYDKLRGGRATVTWGAGGLPRGGAEPRGAGEAMCTP